MPHQVSIGKINNQELSNYYFNGLRFPHNRLYGKTRRGILNYLKT